MTLIIILGALLHLEKTLSSCWSVLCCSLHLPLLIYGVYSHRKMCSAAKNSQNETNKDEFFQWQDIAKAMKDTMLLLLLLPLGRSGSFPYFRTVRGVLPANAVTQIHHSRRPCPDPLLPTLPPFQPSRLASCFYWIHQATPPRARSHGWGFQPPLKRLVQYRTRTRDPEGHELTRYLWAIPHPSKSPLRPQSHPTTFERSREKCLLI